MPFTTPILDNFNRADENPLSGGGSWVARSDIGIVRSMRLVSNQAACQTTGDQAFAAYQAAGTFTDCEAYATLATVGTDRLGVFARIQDSASSADCRGFTAEFNFGAGVRLRGFDSGGSSAVFGTAVAWTPAAGDKLGITCQGTTIKVWTYSGGTWTEMLSRDQSTFAPPYNGWASGYIGIGARAADARLDDFGGGAIVTATQPRPIRINTSQGWADIADATSFVSGTGAPTAAVGATGAIYLNTATGLHYGPKAGGAWPGTPLPVPAGTPADATTLSKGIVQLAGDLAGTAASPQIAAGSIVDADVAAANKDGTAATPSLRTLGTGAQQAAAGNDSRFLKAAIAYGTSLPASPVDGQEAILVDSTTNSSYRWAFRYNAGSSSAYKWEFIGGSPFIHQIVTNETATAAPAWQNLATDGPLFALPRAGDYFTEAQALTNVASGVPGTATFGIAVGDTTPPITSPFSSVNSSWQSMLTSRQLWGGRTAGEIIKLRYQASHTVHIFLFRYLVVWPVRVS